MGKTAYVCSSRNAGIVDTVDILLSTVSHIRVGPQPYYIMLRGLYNPIIQTNYDVELSQQIICLNY